MDDESGESMEPMEEVSQKDWVSQVDWMSQNWLMKGSRELIPETR